MTDAVARLRLTLDGHTTVSQGLRATSEELRRLDQTATRLGGGGGLNRFFAASTLSTKQLQAAMRGLPAQIQDVVVSLQGGQQPLTVLLQQGSQIATQFGSVGAAIGGVGRYMLSLVNPVTASVAAFATFGAVLLAASRESATYANMIVGMGNAAGITAGQMRDLAAAIGQGAHTQGAAGEAIREMVRAGVTGTDNLRRYTQAALDWERATGQSVKTTAEQFAKLAQSPLKAVLELNEGTNFLTESVYRQIKSLEDQGRQTEATRVAQDAWAAALAQRSAEMQQNLGFLERAWASLAGVAKSAWDAMLGIGREETPEQKLVGLQMQLAERIQRGPTNDNPRIAAAHAKGNERLIAQINGLAAEIQTSYDEAAAKAAQAKRLKARATLDAQLAATAPAADRMKREIAEAKALVAEAGGTQAELDKRIKDIQAKYTKSSGGGRRASARAAKDYTDPLAEHAQTFGSVMRSLASAQFEASNAGQDWTRTQRTMAELLQNPHWQQMPETWRQTVQAQADATIALELHNRQQEQARRLTEARLAAQQALAQEGERYARELQSLSRGQEWQQQAQALHRLQDQHQAERQRLDAELRTNQITRQQHAEYLQILSQTHTQALAMESAYQASRAELQSDWRTGANRALDDYLTSARNVAQSAEQLFTRAFAGMEDAIVSFATTGKASVSDLFQSIISDYIRMQARTGLSNLLGGGEGGGLLGRLLSILVPNATGGVYTSASLSAYSGQVVNRPTLFAFARGAGLMGEAGPEAILPLQRGPGGYLGVRAAGAGGGASVTVNVINQAGASVQTRERQGPDGGQVLDVLIQEAVQQSVNAVAGQVASGTGAVTTALRGRYGLRPSMGA